MAAIRELYLLVPRCSYCYYEGSRLDGSTRVLRGNATARVSSFLINNSTAFAWGENVVELPTNAK